jgi:transcriptional regulator with XRE-family HTH domain
MEGTATAHSLKVLGQFLRAKRHRIVADPPSRRRRIQPGLSRDEAATLANIGTSWYARLEAGRIPVPTLSTMRGVSQALQLKPAEVLFALELSGLLPADLLEAQPLVRHDPVVEMICGTGMLSMSLWDKYLAPTGWNAIADAMFLFSECPDRLSRNPVLRLEDEVVLKFFGADYENVARSLVGMFRRAYSTGEPTPYAHAVYERASELAIFRKYWDEHVVADAATSHGQSITRYHPEVGTFSAIPIDLAVPEPHLLVRILSPADDASRAKFEKLKTLGRNYDEATDST